MPSSEGRKSNYRRRFFWLAVFIVVLFGGYSVAWFYAAGKLESVAGEAIARLNQGSTSADCARTTARGFPFRIGLFCDSVRFEDSARAVTASAGAFRSAAQVYDPFHIVAELDGPATLSAPGAGEFGFAWSNLRTSVRFDTDFPERASAEADNFAAEARDDGSTVKLVSFGHAEAHMRRNGEDLDLAASFSGAAVDPRLTQGTRLPPLAGEADLTIDRGVAWARFGARSPRGQSGTIRSLGLSLDATTGLSMSGSFAVGEDCLLDADLKITVRNPKGLGEQLAKALPANADKIRLMFSGMSEGMIWPLKISGGKAMFGAIDVPPLCGRAGS